AQAGCVLDDLIPPSGGDLVHNHIQILVLQSHLAGNVPNPLGGGKPSSGLISYDDKVVDVWKNFPAEMLEARGRVDYNQIIILGGLIHNGSQKIIDITVTSRTLGL